MSGTHREADEDLDIPWCKEIINNPEWRMLPSRQNSTNELFGNTLWTDKTLRAYRSFYKGRPTTPPYPTSIDSGSDTDSNRAGGELRILVSLAAGVDGYSGICHGGLLALLFDDAIHELAAQELPKAITVTLNITYRKPVRTPAVIVCRVWMERKPEGRKAWVKASLENGLGGVHASAEGFILTMNGKL